eukprot:PITA_17950
MAGESHMETEESKHNVTLAFIERILEGMEELESYWTTKMNLVMKDQEDTSKVREELNELRTQNEYTDLKCTKLEDKVKEIEEARDRGLAEILNLPKSLDGARDEIAVLKKAMGHNSGEGVPHVKVKEPESYDGARSTKTLGNFILDMEKYLELLGQSDDETKVKAAAQFLMKDVKALQTHFSPHDETWEARMKIKFIKQTGNLQTYQREFASAVLELPEMAVRDKVFNLIIGLKPWARNEVKR